MEHRLLRASAGTGKTYQLVEAYVDLVLHRGLSPSEIVTITFTRKAAMELKLRIRKKLQTAGVAHGVLTDLARAPISNFHGLALQLLRTFAFAGGLTAGSRVLGEAGDDMLLFMDACEGAWFGGDLACAAAIEALAAHMDVDSALPQALWTAVARAREDGCTMDEALWGKYDPHARQGDAHAQLTQLRATLLQDGATVTGKSKDKLATFGEAPLPLATAPAETWTQGWRAVFTLLDRRGTLGKVYSKEQQEAWQCALSDVAAEHHCVALLPALTTLLTHAWQRYEAAKTSLRAVDFADIIVRLVHLLETREELHAQLRQRYRAVLVDEAQDTNRLQRRMVHLLAGLAGPAAAVTAPARLFVVGDWKQSIYTFRGADPESFGLFAKDLRDRGGQEATLSISRRSAPALVHGINHLGTSLFGDAYERLERLDTANAPQPSAMFWCDGKVSGDAATEGIAPGADADVIALSTGGRPQARGPNPATSSCAATLDSATKREAAMRTGDAVAQGVTQEGPWGRSSVPAAAFAVASAQEPAAPPPPAAVGQMTLSLQASARGVTSVPLASASCEASPALQGSGFRESTSALPASAGCEASRARSASDASESVAEPVSVKATAAAGAPLTDPEVAARVVRARVDGGANPGDFAILLATMTQAPAFAKALADVGIPALLGGGGGLYEQVEIVDTLALLSWLVDRRDHLSGAVALRSPLVGVSDEALLALRRSIPNQPDGLDALHRGMWPLPGRAFNAADSEALAALAALLPQLVASAQQHSAAAFFLDADALLDIRAIYLGLAGGEQRLANLNQLLAQAERFDAAQRGSADRFVCQQQDRIRRGHAEPMASVPAARRAVTISSVHQSKGLQYPVVLLANLGRKGRQDLAPVRYGREVGLVFRPRVGGETHKSARWRQAQDQDNAVQDGELRRLLYVAITRAEREVIFVGPPPEDAGPHGFGGLLAPWAPQALADGLLTQLPLPPAPNARTPGAERAPVTEAEVHAMLARSLDLTAPPGTHFDLSVTQLAAQVQRAPKSTPGLTRDLRAGLTFDPDGERDPPLDPLSRGRLAHQILAAMPRHPQHGSITAFIDSELNMAGFAPEDTRLVDVREDVAHFLSSPLGTTLLKMPAHARRHELPFAMPLEAAPYAATLHGQIDLLAWDAEGPLLVDYKHAHQTDDLAPYLLQLNAYAAAVAHLCQFEGPIRSYLVFLRDRTPPYAHTITPAQRSTVSTQAKALIHRLATASGRLS